jgi:MFS family permease
MIVRNNGNFIAYQFAFLVMEQQYVCRSGSDQEYETCSRLDTVCPALESNAPGFEYKVDTSYQYYLDNWVEAMDLTCTNPVLIGFMMSVYFIGTGISLPLFSWFPDKFGRRLTVIFFLGIMLVTQVMLLVRPSIYTGILFFSAFGLCS